MKLHVLHRPVILLAMAVLLVAPSVTGGATEPEHQTLRLTMKEALALTLVKNPDVRLFKVKLTAATAVAFTQLGALLPNVGGNVRQTRQTFFLGTVGWAHKSQARWVLPCFYGHLI